MWRIRYLYNSIYNLFYYFRVVWKDRDFDFMFIEHMLERKLRKTYKRYKNNDIFEGQYKTTIQPLRICIEALSRRGSSYYWNASNYDSYLKVGKYDWCYADVREKELDDLIIKLISKYKNHWWD